ncbi:hypothetical protein GBAR_LOCUS28528 [Geodia barretti]|uniref:Uncharacterized protein n=1 Tax=Geodia barretti TaxID=519541 RepID=A0AA35TQF3_GEOBA|nr:hypothetical protein GBAR_LOCUS28528 [Geodia barretti]
MERYTNDTQKRTNQRLRIPAEYTQQWHPEDPTSHHTQYHTHCPDKPVQFHWSGWWRVYYRHTEEPPRPCSLNIRDCQWYLHSLHASHTDLILHSIHQYLWKQYYLLS